MTLKFTVFSREDGRILFSGEASDPMQFESDADGVLVGYAFPPPGWIDGEAYCPVPEQTSPFHVFNYSTKQWEDPRTLVDLKANKWSDIKRARDAQEFGTFFWDGSEFDCDQVSQARIQGAVLSAVVANSMGVPYSVEWTLADNTKRTLSASEVIAMGIAFGQNTTAVHEKARQLRVLIDQAQSKEELESITW